MDPKVAAMASIVLMAFCLIVITAMIFADTEGQGTLVGFRGSVKHPIYPNGGKDMYLVFRRKDGSYVIYKGWCTVWHRYPTGERASCEGTLCDYWEAVNNGMHERVSDEIWKEAMAPFPMRSH